MTSRSMTTVFVAPAFASRRCLYSRRRRRTRRPRSRRWPIPSPRPRWPTSSSSTGPGPARVKAPWSPGGHDEDGQLRAEHHRPRRLLADGDGEGTAMGGMPPFEGMFHMAWDPAAKNYVMFWVDSMGGWSPDARAGLAGRQDRLHRRLADGHTEDAHPGHVHQEGGRHHEPLRRNGGRRQVDEDDGRDLPEVRELGRGASRADPEVPRAPAARRRCGRTSSACGRSPAPRVSAPARPSASCPTAAPS